MHYLRWAKSHRRARYELALSGVPPIALTDLTGDEVHVDLEVAGQYGDPAFIRSLSALYGVPESSVLPVPGTSSANFMAIAIAAKAGDSILVESPCYDPLERAAAFLQIRVMPFQRRTQTNDPIDLQAIDHGLRSGAKAVVVSNLHNPSGQFLRKKTIESIATRCEEHGATLIVDEVYLDARHILYHEPRWSAAALGHNIIATSSLTKVYGLGGLRAGWIMAGDRYRKRLRDLMDVMSVENPGPVASLANVAMSVLPSLEQRYRMIHTEGAAIFDAWIKTEPHLRRAENQGALFEWVRLPEGVPALRLCELLEQEFDTQIVSGHFFGADDHVRMSLTPPKHMLEPGLTFVSEAMRRLMG